VEVKRKVGYLPDDVGFYDDRTGVENLIYTAELNGFSRVSAREKSRRTID
jgi:ABC-2 type transport system ATP-binding protein